MRQAKCDLNNDQVAFIKSNWHKMSNGAMSKKMGINFSTLSGKLHSMGLFRMHFEYWTKEQVDFLKANYKSIGDKELAILFNGMWEKEKRWSFKHIEKKRRYLNLKRTISEIKKIKMRNVNRGCWEEMGTWKTRHAAPEGSIRVWQHKWQTRIGFTTCQFKAIKINGKFVHYARWLYQATFGAMKTGYVVGFKDRNNLNVVPENLESISRAEHARRNRIKYPDEINSLEQILKQFNNALKRKYD